MTFSSGGPVVALDLAALPAQLAHSYAVGGIPLPTQPSVATAPLSLGGHLSLGDTFALLFASPDALTLALLANGATATMQFLLPGGVLVSAPVSLAASYSAPTLSVVVTLLAPVSTLPADLPLLLFSSTSKAGAFMTVGVFGRLPTDLSGFPVLGVYDPSTHSVLAAQAAPASQIVTDSTNSVVYVPLLAYLANATALGQATSANSSPVVLPSDQIVPVKRSASVLLDTTQTGISATYQSAALPVGQYDQLILLYNLSAFTGTSVTFKIRAQDTHSNNYTIVASGALTATATQSLFVGPGNSGGFGNSVIVEATAASVTSMTFTAVLIGK